MNQGEKKIIVIFKHKRQQAPAYGVFHYDGARVTSDVFEAGGRDLRLERSGAQPGRLAACRSRLQGGEIPLCDVCATCGEAWELQSCSSPSVHL